MSRFISGLYLLFYTIIRSFPLIFGIIYMTDKGYRSFYNYYIAYDYSGIRVFRFIFFFIFLVKFPMFGFHLWLLKAHVEAPAWGSMILAGIMLKVGGYGMMRMVHLWEFRYLLKNFFFFFCLWGGLIRSYTCFVMNDLKIIVAISSVVHMRFCVGCLITLSIISFKGCLIIMVRHGLSSAGLFYFCGCFYNVAKSRSIYMVKGLINRSPLVSIMWFLLCSSNLSCPPTINLLGELLRFFGIRLYSLTCGFVSFIIVITIFFCTCYSIYIYYGFTNRFYSTICTLNVNIRLFIIFFFFDCHLIC